jgi:hypothetical protein
MTILRTFFLSAALGTLAWGGEAFAAAPEGAMPDDIQRASLQAVENLRHQQLEPLEKEATEASRRQDLPTILNKMAAAFPNGKLTLIRTVGYEVVSDGAGDTSYFASFEYQFPERWVLVRLEWQRVSGNLRLNGLNLQLMGASIEKTNAFTFNGKGLVNYMIVCLAVLAPIFTLYTLYLCLRTPALKWKWLWALVILVGVGSLSLNWTTGDSRLTMLTFKILSVSWIRTGYGPWVVSVGLPLGALVFLGWLTRLKKAKAPPGASAVRA